MHSSHANACNSKSYTPQENQSFSSVFLAHNPELWLRRDKTKAPSSTHLITPCNRSPKFNLSSIDWGEKLFNQGHILLQKVKMILFILLFAVNFDKQNNCRGKQSHRELYLPSEKKKDRNIIATTLIQLRDLILRRGWCSKEVQCTFPFGFVIAMRQF